MNQARVALRDAADELMPTLGETEQALASGDFATALSLLVRWNEAVMRRRNAGPWIEVDEGRLKINYPGEEPVLPARDELGRLWRNSYFIPSLQRIALQLERRR